KEKPDYTYNDQTTFHLFALDDAKEAEAAVHAHDGTVLAVCKIKRDGTVYKVALEGEMKSWAVCLRNLEEVVSVSCGSLSDSPEGALITFSVQEKECRIVTA
ncbi:MAG: alpha-xylosidase, partial [Spirochaetales bacterium]|nr:alpha-xylosidase [Spirochaetales bacterium]